MNKTKSSNPVRLIAFFLTAILLICTFGFTADGWQIGDEKNNEASDIITNKPTEDTDNAESPSEGETDEEKEEPDIYIPKYINRLTGLEVSEDVANGAHIAFVMDPTLPSYGISGADVICEIATENDTRFIAFIPEKEKLWKIGALTHTRGYISNIAKYFGGVCVSYGSDDSINYSSCDIKDTHLNLTLDEKYHYTEFQSNVYTNSDLLSAGITESGTNIDKTKVTSLPYLFPDFGSEPLVYGDSPVKKIKINVSGKSYNELSYNEATAKYSVIRNGSSLTDAINGKLVDFDNCFVLFADSVIYDNPQCTQMVMDTIGSGVGYYFSHGGICEIKWSGSVDGVMKFSLLDGSDLIINRGNAYIMFLRSSTKENIVFE